MGELEETVLVGEEEEGAISTRKGNVVNQVMEGMGALEGEGGALVLPIQVGPMR